MAVNDTTLVNGVTKIETSSGFKYLFPLAKITTITDTEQINVYTKENPVRTSTYLFEDLTEQLGASDAETYVDALAEGGFFFNSPTDVNVLNSITSSLNSTTTLLTAGSTFTGTAELNAYPDVMITVKTDQNGTLYFDFSPDGTNFDSTLSFQYDTSRINPPHILVKGARYFRARFVNDSTSDQTYIRLLTEYGQFNKLTAPINGTLSENFDALATRPTNYTEEVAQGKRQGRMTWNKWGYNDDVDTGSEEIIAAWGGTWSPPTTAETIDIVSTSANDTNSSGTGLRSIVVTGIDENREEQIEVFNLNGTTTVTSSSLWLGINRVSPFLCGTLQTNDGSIDVQQTTSAIVLAKMPAGETVTQQAIFYVQNNHTFLASGLHINIIKLSGGGGDPEVTIRGWVFSPVANAKIQIFKAKIDTAVENTVEIPATETFPVTENSVLYFTAETDKNNTSVDLRFSGKEVRNS